MYITNFHAIEERIKSERGAVALLVAKAGPRARAIIDLSIKEKIRVERTGVHELNRLAGDNRGIALEVHNSNDAKAGFEELLDGLEGRETALVVILDEVTDPHNYGAILRSCDQFGVDFVVSRSKRIANQTDVVAHSSAGASAWVQLAQVPNLPRAIEQLKEAGFWVYGADMSGETAFKKKLNGRVAVVLGGEAGLSRLLCESCDALVSIPSLGHVDSLNVSCAAAVLLYEIIRQRD
ncbi:MAG: 23S rRNA (guanosine(2251)-2'-O)-methyltransferase RlmB [Termitinemataceae bacterium]|nr:MAG: 23S rRNA (guanosine(2251)-2'-O)-methyltransferase RlmB [Termitinemataceae bacterium]